jgi:hypothetical protein
MSFSASTRITEEPASHPRLEGGELGVSHVAEPFRDRVGRKVEV